MSETDFDVLISGGGPVGLGLAIELGQRGVSVGVVERNVEPPRIPKGQNLTQRTMEHMQAWGVEDDIRAAKTIPKGVGLGGLTAYGSLLSGYHYDWFKRAAVDPYYNATNERLPQYETEAVLRRRAADLDTVQVFYGWKTTAISQDDASVTLTASDGTKDADYSAKYLVGCDGSHSFVRKAAGITETSDDHERTMALIVFESEEFFHLISQFPDKQFYNALHPEHDGYWMFFGMVEWGKSFFFHAPVPKDTNRENFDFKAYLRRAVGADFEMDLDYVGFWDLRIALADHYRAGRVFIAGDAAHSHPPYGGYGINTGFEDARNLGWKLAADLQGWGGPNLLDSYEFERRPVFASTAGDFIARFIEEDRAFVREYSPDQDLTAFESAWAKRASGGDIKGIGAFAPHYEGSPAITGSDGMPSAVGEHSFELKPGHHLPPLKTIDGGSVTDQLGTGLTVLAGSDELAQANGLTELNDIQTLVLVSEGGSSLPNYSVVRPDGFVAGTANTADEIVPILAQAVGNQKSI